MDKLKPCPFCGGEAELMYTNDNKHQPFVRCKLGAFEKPTCPAARLHFWDYKTEADAIEAWNRRADDGKTDRRGRSD